VPQAEVGGYLAQAHAFVLNSSYEGLPHVVLEAFAAGTPVIATDAGGTSEVVQHNSTGLLVPPGDNQALKSAIERLWQEPELAKRLAQAANAHLQERFDFGRMIARTEETLCGVATGSRLLGAKAEAVS
jgi:glycosyltransferase involved in cell wall biosynthesis